MSISVIIPVYNIAKELLERCLVSIISQIADNDEIVIIDDGSTSESSAEYRSISDTDKRIHYYNQTNAGPSVARNQGVFSSVGDYILFVDADDYLVPGCIEQAKMQIASFHPDMVFGYVYKDLFDGGVAKEYKNEKNPECILIDNNNDIASFLNHILGYEQEDYGYNNGYISDGPICRFFRRDLFTNNQFDTIPRWNEDTLWNIELIKDCKTIVICKSLWYIYAVRSGSAMQGYRSNCYEEFEYITKKEYDIGHLIWKGRIDKGIAYRVWHDIFILSRGFIFNSKNNNSFFEKYNMLKRAICTDSYQIAINIVDFRFEKRIFHKIVKITLNYMMRHRVYWVVYILIKIYVGNS